MGQWGLRVTSEVVVAHHHWGGGGHGLGSVFFLRLESAGR